MSTLSPFRRGQGSFKWLWGATVSAGLSEGLALTVIPLLMTTLTRDPVLVSLLQTGAALPWLLFGLQAGALVDRWDRGRTLFFCDIARATLVAALVVIVSFNALQVWTLYAFVFLSAIATVLFRAAETAILPSIVESEDLGRANSALKTGQSISGSFVGPALGGVLIGVSVLASLCVQAASFAASAFCLGRLPHRSRKPEPSGLSVGAEVREGLRFVWSDRVLRTLLGATALQGAGIWMLMAVLVLFALQVLAVPAAAYGFLITAYAVGSFMGAAVCGPVETRLGSRTSLVLAAALAGAAVISLSASVSYVLALICMLVLGVAGMALTILALTLRQRRTPNGILGRASSLYNVVNVGSAPFVAPLSGYIGSHFGLAMAVAVAGGCLVVAAAVLLVGLRGSTAVIEEVQT